MSGVITQISVAAEHTVSKTAQPRAHLIAGIGIEGDAHAGPTVRHRPRVRRDPAQPNLRQVHLIHAELLDRLQATGFDVAPGMMGENLTTRGISLLDLPRGTQLYIGATVRLRVTGLRNPCRQLDGVRPGLLQAVLDRDTDGELIRLAGIMSVVERGGDIFTGDPIVVELPAPPHDALQPV